MAQIYTVHIIMDKLLAKTGERLVRLSEDNCSVYRLGGDEFIILCENFKQEKGIETLSV